VVQPRTGAQVTADLLRAPPLASSPSPTSAVDHPMTRSTTFTVRNR
jgi:hypothetical protein